MLGRDLGYTYEHGPLANAPPRSDIPSAGLAHERSRPSSRGSRHTSLCGDTWARTRRDTCTPSANAPSSSTVRS
jgi:hypothetical protein